MILPVIRSWWRSSDRRVSDRWLRQYAQSQSRVEFHGVEWNWEWMKAAAVIVPRGQAGQRRTA